VKCGRTGRARILHVDDWDAGGTDAIEEPLAGRDPLHRVAAAGHLDRRIVESRIGQGGVDRLLTEILEGFVRVPPERRHSDSDHTHIGTVNHFKPPASYFWVRVMKRNRYAMGMVTWTRTAGQLTFRIKHCTY